MSKLTEQWIELFRAGKFKPGNCAAEIAFSNQDLAQIAESYDPAKNEAPVVVGHPALNAPAFGWVEKLRADGGALFGKLKQIHPEFEQMVESGLFKKRSIALNKTAGGWELRHVGFLGAAPPVIKGLADAVFNDSGERFEFAVEEEAVDANEKGLIDQMKAFFAGLTAAKPGEPAVKTFSEDDVKRIVAEATQPLVQKIATIETTAQQQATTFAEREQRLAQAEIGAAAAGKIAQLKSEGKWVPAFDAMGVPKLFSELAKSTVTIEFAEGDKKENLSLLDTAVKIFGALPKIVPGGTLVQGGRTGTTASFAENPGSRANVDSNSVQLNQLAEARAKEKNITFAEALPQVIAERPELTVPGGASAGQV